jgi:hypothetical protein
VSLRDFLVERIPQLTPHLDQAVEDYADPVEDEELSDYGLLTWGVRPYIEECLVQSKTGDLRALFALLEELYQPGHGIQNSIELLLEDLDTTRPRIWPFLGPKLAAHEVEALIWIPWGNDHVDMARYRARWAEEMRKRGGLNQLTFGDSKRIKKILYDEFKVDWSNRKNG